MSIDQLPAEVLRQHKGISFVGIVTTFIMYDKNGEFLWPNVVKMPEMNMEDGRF